MRIPLSSVCISCNIITVSTNNALEGVLHGWLRIPSIFNSTEVTQQVLEGVSNSVLKQRLFRLITPGSPPQVIDNN